MIGVTNNNNKIPSIKSHIVYYNKTSLIFILYSVFAWSLIQFQTNDFNISPAIWMILYLIAFVFIILIKCKAVKEGMYCF